MAKSIRQFRYYNELDTKRNYPVGNSDINKNISLANLGSGSIFFSESSLTAITQLGIQSLPGTKFYINNSVNPIIIGSTGVYELDLEGVSEITSLRFDNDSLEKIKSINNAFLIVDAIYEIEE